MSRESPPGTGTHNPPGRPVRKPGRRVADLRLGRDSPAVPAFEEFTATLEFLSSGERSVLTIAGDEVIENLITHGEVGPAGIAVRVRKAPDRLILSVLVESHSRFADFAGEVASGELPGPRYNTELRRWHGLGLTMCRNLASRVSYRAGELTDRVILEFTLSPRP